jgi:hypothetical protein
MWIILERYDGRILDREFTHRGDAISVANAVQELAHTLGWKKESYTVIHKTDSRFVRGVKFKRTTPRQYIATSSSEIIEI